MKFLILATALAAPSAALAHPSGDQLQRFLEMAPKVDANHDGAITRDEWRNFRGAEFERLDRNHDGVVSADDADTRAWARVVGDVDPARKDEIPDADLATRTTTQRHHMSAPSFARKQTIKLLSEWERGDKLVMLVGYNAAGEGRHWFNIVNEPQREWVLEKFEMLHHTLTTMDITAAVSETINPRSESRKMPSDED